MQREMNFGEKFESFRYSVEISFLCFSRSQAQSTTLHLLALPSSYPIPFLPQRDEQHHIHRIQPQPREKTA
jgi:hypothetical protein